MSILKKITTLLVGDSTQFKKQPLQLAFGPKVNERDLLRQESKIGATLFGEVPKGHNREFFCLDESTWIWHEEWKDEKGVEQQSTIRYEIHPNGILKVSDGPRYQFIEGEELENFAKATKLYYEKTAIEIYKRDPRTGLKLA
jgi:hypothetical protein